METAPDFVPPYGIPWRTFLNSLDHMKERPLPNRLDRSYLTWLPGLHQTYFMAAAKGFGLTDADNCPSELLHRLVREPEQRPALVRDLVQRFYSAPLQLVGRNATTATLMDFWKETFGQDGETRRKAVTFFLHAARYAQVDLSPHWESGVRSSTRTNGTTRTRRKAVKPQETTGTAESARTERPPSGDSYAVELRSAAGRVELRVDVDLFKISRDDRAFVLQLVDALRDYDAAVSGENPAGASPPQETSAGAAGAASA